MNFPTDTADKASPLAADKILIADSANGNNAVSSSLSNLPISNATQTALDGKEPAFTKNTAFNKDFGTTSGTVSEGSHTHSELHTHSNKTTLDQIVGNPVETITAGTNINVTRNGNDVTIDSVASGGHIIQDEGVSLTARTNLDFVGTAVTATDDSVNDKTIITIDAPANTLDGLSDTTITTPSGGQALTYNATTNVWENTTLPGGGDMLASTYDPNTIGADVFNQDNMVSGITNVNYTATEQTKLAGIADSANNYVITSDIDDVTPATTKVFSSSNTQSLLDGKEPAFTKNTGFNLNLGTTAGTVSEGNHTHDGVYEPAFTKNTGFNLNLGTTAGTVLEGNTNVGIVGTKTVDETNIADTNILAYNATSGNLEYVAQASGGGTGLTLYDGQIAGEQVVGNVLSIPAMSAFTLNTFKISLATLPAGVDFIATISKNGVVTDTATITTTATATNGVYITKIDSTTAFLEDDLISVDITQIGSTVAGSDFTFQLA